MGSNEKGLAACAMELDARSGLLHADVSAFDLRSSEACMVLRLAFANESGYARAINYTAGNADNLPDAPFDAEAAHTEITPWKGGSLTIDLNALAPEGWNGRVMVSFLLRDAGENSWVQIALR